MLGTHWVPRTRCFLVPKETCDAAMTFLQAGSKCLSLLPEEKKNPTTFLSSFGRFLEIIFQKTQLINSDAKLEATAKAVQGPTLGLWRPLCSRWLPAVISCLFTYFLQVFVYTTSSDPILRWEGISFVHLCHLRGINLVSKMYPVTTFFPQGVSTRPHLPSPPFHT